MDELESFRNYQRLIAEVDGLCRRIRQNLGKYIACKKGCAGNCCRRHISVFAIEAVAFAKALHTLPPKDRHHLRQKARCATTFGPCPLLEEGACLMYDSRAIICRTHGFPILTTYRGHQSIGFCQKNFRNLPTISKEAVIELAPLNNSLMAINRQFVSEFSNIFSTDDRVTIGEALLIDL